MSKNVSKFRTELGYEIFSSKYAHKGCETWDLLADCLANVVCGKYLPKYIVELIALKIKQFKFIPGGRYLYYGNRGVKFFKNCFLFRSQEDTREDWASTIHRHIMASSAGGGCGNVYSVYRVRNSLLQRTGGVASGAVSAMKMVNDGCRELRQGGGRRVALWGGLHATHGDAYELCHVKDWDNIKIGKTNYGELKRENFDFHAPLDCMNISLIYNKAEDFELPIFKENIKMALKNGEPGFSFDFQDPEECLRNACTEITSSKNDDSCNIGSINFANLDSIQDLVETTELGSSFLYCGNMVADFPTEETRFITNENMRIGLGLMGLHEWMLKRGYRYEMVPLLESWLQCWMKASTFCNGIADGLSRPRPIKYRSIAPTGTIGIMAGTTTGIEPIYAVAYKRRFLDGNKWKYKMCVDGTADILIKNFGISPEKIETAMDLSKDVERRIKFQADVQKYVDQGISSTVNLPANGSLSVDDFSKLVKKYGPMLRGLTVYPDGARGGQPLSSCSYEEAINNTGTFIEDNESCKGGVCGV